MRWNDVRQANRRILRGLLTGFITLMAAGTIAAPLDDLNNRAGGRRPGPTVPRAPSERSTREYRPTTPPVRQRERAAEQPAMRERSMPSQPTFRNQTPTSHRTGREAVAPVPRFGSPSHSGTRNIATATAPRANDVSKQPAATPPSRVVEPRQNVSPQPRPASVERHESPRPAPIQRRESPPPTPSKAANVTPQASQPVARPRDVNPGPRATADPGFSRGRERVGTQDSATRAVPKTVAQPKDAPTVDRRDSRPERSPRLDDVRKRLGNGDRSRESSVVRGSEKAVEGAKAGNDVRSKEVRRESVVVKPAFPTASVEAGSNPAVPRKPVAATEKAEGKPMVVPDVKPAGRGLPEHGTKSVERSRAKPADLGRGPHEREKSPSGSSTGSTSAVAKEGAKRDDRVGKEDRKRDDPLSAEKGKESRDREKSQPGAGGGRGGVADKEGHKRDDHRPDIKAKKPDAPKVRFADDWKAGRLNHLTATETAKKLQLAEQYRMRQQGDIARRLELEKHREHHKFHHGPVSPVYHRHCFQYRYWGPSFFVGVCWYPTWTAWVNWSWHYQCHPYWDPRPIWCRPVIYEPWTTWVYWEVPVWRPLPVVECGTWVDLKPVVLPPEQHDLELLAVRFVDPGHPEEKTGPRYRVWFRNNSSRPITDSFVVMLMAGNDDRPAEALPRAGVRVRSIETNDVQSVDIRLPMSVYTMGRDENGMPKPFSVLHVLVDANQQIRETSKANNGAKLAPQNILPVDPAAFEIDPTTGRAGGEVLLAGEGFGPQPGRVLLHVQGKEIDAEILGWYDLGVRWAVPKLGLAGPVEADVIVIRGDGAAANPLRITLTP